MRNCSKGLIAAVLVSTLAAQNDWPVYGHDPGGARYSPLTEINAKNVTKLRRAWTYHTGDKGRQFESTPIVVGGRMYLSTQTSRIVALEPETGREIWSYDPKVRRPREHRGVAWWPGDAETSARILFGTGDGRLIALEAATGKPVSGFGVQGEVNLRDGVADKFPTAPYGITSPPAVYQNLVIVAPSTQEGPSRGPSGDPRAFDVRTGKLVWRFHTVPQPGEPGNETWGPDGWKDRSGPSAWGLIHTDVERGLVLLSTGNPADSWYGADRKGTNLYANSVLALEADTGKLRWHFQIVHHDIFDYDVPGAPALVEVVKDNRRTPAVAQITKMGLLFILDAVTGKPIFGVEERPVPKSEMAGEDAWPTQPFPVKPLPLSRTTIRREELTKRTPEAQRFCEELFDTLKVADMYAPFGKTKTLTFPGAMGGGNWGGVSFDPKLGYIFVNTTNMGNMGVLVPAPPGSPMPYRNDIAYARFVDHERYPCQKPPWGELIAVNANTGEIAWKVPLGDYEELAGQGLGKTGTPNVGGSIVTAAGLVFIASTNDSRLRAFEARSGKELWAGRLEGSGNATPVTYLGRDGHQYVVVAAGGPAHLRNIADNSNTEADSLVAFSLSGKEPDPVLTSSTKQAVPAVAKPAGPGGGAAALPGMQGKQEVVRMCTTCHGAGTFTNLRMSRDEWQSEVDYMVSRGARGTESEIQTVIDYLAKNFSGPAGTLQKLRRK